MVCAPRRASLRRLARLLAVAWLTLASSARAGEIVAVTNAANPVEEMSLKQLRLLYGGYKRAWRDGTPVHLLLPLSGDPALEFLVRRVFREDSEADVARYYLEAIFQQKLAEEPPQLPAAAALARVREHRGAIALVDEDAVADPSGLRLLSVGDR